MRLQSLLDALVRTGLAEARKKLIHRNVSNVWHDTSDQQKMEPILILNLHHGISALHISEEQWRTVHLHHSMLSNLAEMAELAAVSSSAGASSLKAAGRLAMAADAEHVEKK